MPELGMRAPNFALPDPSAGSAPWPTVTLDEVAGQGPCLVAFLSNHCPYVKHIADALADFARDFGSKGLGIVAIGANDAEAYPADAPERMTEEATLRGYTFPYLYDESQDVAKSYKAACTPDFFLFDADRRLVYRGQFDDSRPGNGRPVTGADLRAAAEDVLAGHPAAAEQAPSIGCNIKWKPGNAPEYFG